MIRKTVLTLCLLLATVLLLNGCIYPGHPRFTDKTAHYEDMAYEQPDMANLYTLLEACRVRSEGSSLRAILDSIYDFYDAYDSFYTNYALANIHYCSNLNDIYWQQEFEYCQKYAPEADALLDELYYILSRSPLRQQLESEAYFGAGFFESYDDNTPPDEHYLSLLKQESELVSQYYALSEEALSEEYYSEAYFSVYGSQMSTLFTELIALRQEIAGYLGYASYPEYAYEAYFYRDYTPQEAEAYLEAVGHTFYDLYCGLEDSDVWSLGGEPCGETQTWEYVKQVSRTMGGDISEAFSHMEKYGLYDIGYSENKYNASFETYLWSYSAPFIFMNAQLTQEDKLTLAHEFGHFLNDYLCGGSYVGTDIAEVHSQAFEYLSLCYSESSEDLTRYKLADSLSVYMECAAYALFEQRVYQLTGDELTVENIEDLYREIGTQFGFDTWQWDPRDYVTVTHYFTNPMYNVSYVVSNDLAMQFYRMEQEAPGTGLALYEKCLLSEDSYIIAFASEYGLDNPFTSESLTSMAELFREVLYEN